MSSKITIGRHEIAIQVLQCSDQLDRQVPGIAASPTPLPVEAWPMTADEIAVAANAKLTASGGKPDQRPDCLWALHTLDMTPAFVERALIVREATTVSQRATQQHRWRRDYLRGDIG